ncbi:MAG TPA: hypothetical protein VEH31_17550 [Streptosporangiaceae bacterium]|nr:hypothetical protein [Streptosporangiaceae bacterium]
MSVNWLESQPYRCFFYPDRDCPGWHAGQPCDPGCLRMGRLVPPAGGR